MSNSRSIEDSVEFFPNNMPVLNDPLDSIGNPFQMSEITRRKTVEPVATYRYLLEKMIPFSRIKLPTSETKYLLRRGVLNCKEVITTLENGIKDGGEKFAPVLVSGLKKSKHSDCVVAGVQTLDFWKINQQLDQHLYKDISDFVKDVQMLLKDVADNSAIASEVIVEVDAIHTLFLDLMERTFVNLDFSGLKVPLSLQI